MFKGVIGRFNKAKLRYIMRGYRTLKRKNQIHIIKQVKDDLVRHNFFSSKLKASKWMFGSGSEQASIALNQYLYSRVLSLYFNKELLYSIGKNSSICYPLPSVWRKNLTQHGFKVNNPICSFQWGVFVALFFATGILNVLSIFWYSFIGVFSFKNKKKQPYAYFNKLTPANVPNHNFISHTTIIDWYLEWNDSNKSIKSVHHGVKLRQDIKIRDIDIKYAPLFKKGFDNLSSIVFFINWLIVALFICFKDILFLRWHNLLLFNQFVFAAKVRYTPEHAIAKDYLFSLSNYVYRPIWTYEAEELGARVIFYFYATNVEEFKKEAGYIKTTNGWQLANWNYVLAWDDYQKDFVRRTFYSYDQISTVGKINFVDSSQELILRLNKEKIAAVFDVQPHRASRFQILGAKTTYYDSNVAIQFLSDIYQVLSVHRITLAHKRKREIGNVLHPNYKKTINLLGKKIYYKSVDPGIVADDVISQVDFVISMPFTSVALLAQYQDKPSIYYDPFGDVQKDDRAAHGIPVIVGIDELRTWVNNIVKDATH
jgi:polysaccharide biosynthesis PFTS motif protein